jgi:Na+-driven multidrug efflux pump
MNSTSFDSYRIKHPNLHLSVIYFRVKKHLSVIDLYDSHLKFEQFSGGLLIGRTIAVFLTLTLSTSLAAREGPVPMAGYEICLQVWLTISLLNDALALAGQVCKITGMELSSNSLPEYPCIYL